jgi:hypothetical protein
MPPVSAINPASSAGYAGGNHPVAPEVWSQGLSGLIHTLENPSPFESERAIVDASYPNVQADCVPSSRGESIAHITPMRTAKANAARPHRNLALARFEFVTRLATIARADARSSVLVEDARDQSFRTLPEPAMLAVTFGSPW